MRRSTRFASRNLRFESLEARQLLAVVTSAADSGPGTLRQSIIDESAGGTITFDTAMMGGTEITLSSGDLIIDKALTIDGSDGSGGRVTVNAAGTSRVFYIDNPSTVSPGPTDVVTLTNLVITGGDSADSTLRYGPYADGGGIQSFESLILDNVVVTGNKSLDLGAAGSGADAGGLGHGREASAMRPHGGLAGYLIIRDSEFSDNTARDDGGGLDFYNATDITITGTTFRDNTVGDPAGGNIAGTLVGPAWRIIDVEGATGGSSVLLDDVTVMNNSAVGSADLGNVGALAGGGLISNNNNQPMDLTIRDSTFSGNTMLFDLDPEETYYVDFGRGGGLYVNVEDVRVYDSTFEDNYAYGLGGAVMIAEGYATSTVLFDNVTMTGNGIGPIAGNLTGEGGAIAALNFNDVEGDITVTVRNSMISGNSAFNGGGLLFQQGASGIVENTTVDGNYATTSGGISFQPLSQPPGPPSYLKVIDSTISNNTATQNGGGIFADDYFNYSLAPVTIERTTITGNVALAAQDDGMGVYTGGHGGGLMVTALPLTVINSTISGNSAGVHGGGVFVGYYTYPDREIRIQNSTITLNVADADQTDMFSGTGGGLYSDGNVDGSIHYSPVELENTIVSGNSRLNGGASDIGDVGSSAGGQQQVTARYSFIGTNNGSFFVPGNPDANGNKIGGAVPLDAMLSPLQDNGGPTQTHGPLAGSPVIDMGDPAFASPPDTDQRGEARVDNGRIDMGSVEGVVSAGLNCDFDGNGECDIDDVDMLTMELAAGGMNLMFDVNGDGVIDDVDLSDWLAAAGAMNLDTGNPYLVGDFTLDGVVDGLDFIEWNNFKFSATGKWSMGDANADGITDGLDFIDWNNNKFTSSGTPNPILLSGGDSIRALDFSEGRMMRSKLLTRIPERAVSQEDRPSSATKGGAVVFTTPAVSVTPLDASDKKAETSTELDRRVVDFAIPATPVHSERLSENSTIQSDKDEEAQTALDKFFAVLGTI